MSIKRGAKYFFNLSPPFDFPWHLSHSHNYSISNLATQDNDIYRGNSTLTLFEPDCPWISYREAFAMLDATFAWLLENRSITGLSRLFSFNPWHQTDRLHVPRDSEEHNHVGSCCLEIGQSGDMLFGNLSEIWCCSITFHYISNIAKHIELEIVRFFTIISLKLVLLSH